MASGAVSAGARAGRSRPQDVDRHVGAKVRERRLALGLTQQQLAEMVGTTYQQAHKYEKGVNRISAGRLHVIAGALGVGPGYFFGGLDKDGPARPSAGQRRLLEFSRSLPPSRARTRRPSPGWRARSPGRPPSRRR